MATALHVDKLPLLTEEESGWQEADWEHVPNIHHHTQQDNINDEPNNNRYSSLIEEEEDDDEEEEVGVKGVADVDYTPQQEDCCIDLQKGEQIPVPTCHIF